MPVKLAYRTYRLFWEALDWIYPPTCGGCGVSGTRWCGECTRVTPEITPPVCPICGNPNQSDGPCKRCQESPPSFTGLQSRTIFTGVIREAIHRYKYKHDIGLGEALSRLMITNLEKLNWTLDIVTSVPLGLVRLKERGYNQATLLARPIALSMGLPFSSQALMRVRETKTQVGLSVNERHENMVGAFKAKMEIIQGKNVLLIDDVATSGATLNACANALLEQGASKVYGYTLARAVFQPDGHIDLT